MGHADQLGDTSDLDPLSESDEAQRAEDAREAYLNQRSADDDESYLAAGEREIFDEINRRQDKSLDADALHLSDIARSRGTLARVAAAWTKRKAAWQQMLRGYAEQEPTEAVRSALAAELKNMKTTKKRGRKSTALPLAAADVRRVEKVLRELTQDDNWLLELTENQKGRADYDPDEWEGKLSNIKKRLHELGGGGLHDCAVKFAALRWQIRMFDISGTRIVRPNPSPADVLANFMKRGARKKKIPTRG